MRMKTDKFITSICTMMPYMFFMSRAYATVVSGAGISGDLAETLGEIISILFWFACFGCTIKLLHIGILYMTTSVEGKSKAKGAMIPWLVGAFICVTFATVGPWIMDLFYTPRDVLSY